MMIGNRDRERFWIALTVRAAFGFMFLFAAINIFFAGWDPKKSLFKNAGENLTAFVTGLSAPYESSWVNFKYPSRQINPDTGAPQEVTEVGLSIVRWFLYGMPFIMTVLSVLLLTGLYLRPALRASALFLVFLGLGKYLTDFRGGNTITTMQDFLYAMFICFALFALSREPDPSQHILGRG